MIRPLQALMVISVAALLASASASAAPVLLGPGSYPIGPLSTDHDGTLKDKTKFTTAETFNLSLNLHSDLNAPAQAHRPYIRIVILQVGGNHKTELFDEKLKFTGSLDLDLPTLIAGLAPTGPGAFYVIRVVAKLAHNGGGFDGSFTLSPVPVPAALWLFGTALVGLGAFARRRAAMVG